MKVRKGGGEEIPFVQGKEQWLCFAGAAVKKYPTPKVRETQVKIPTLYQMPTLLSIGIFIKINKTTCYYSLLMITGFKIKLVKR